MVKIVTIKYSFVMKILLKIYLCLGKENFTSEAFSKSWYLHLLIITSTNNKLLALFWKLYNLIMLAVSHHFNKIVIIIIIIRAFVFFKLWKFVGITQVYKNKPHVLEIRPGYFHVFNAPQLSLSRQDFY